MTAHSNQATLSFCALVDRFRQHFKLKSAILVCLLVTVCLPFLLLERHPLLAVTYCSENWVDREIPFTPMAAWPYLSLWLYIALGGMMLVRKRDCWRCCWIMVAMGLIGNFVFLIHPTAVPARPEVSIQPYVFVLANDGTGNACPSLHVAYTVVAAIMIQDWLSCFRGRTFLRGIAWTWGVVIILSTMAIRQHLAIDVAWGIVLGIGGGIAWRKDLPGLFSSRLAERRRSTPKEGGKSEENDLPEHIAKSVKEREVIASLDTRR